MRGARERGRARRASVNEYARSVRALQYAESASGHCAADLCQQSSEIEQHRPGTHRVAVMVVISILAALDEERRRVGADRCLPGESQSALDSEFAQRLTHMAVPMPVFVPSSTPVRVSVMPAGRD